MHWKAITGVLLRCREEALLTHMMRARAAAPLQGEKQADIFGELADRLREEGRNSEARFFERIAGTYESNAVMNRAIVEADTLRREEEAA